MQRNIPQVQPRNNPGLMKLALDQVKELMTNYGPVDIVFFDGEPHQLRDLAWKLQPDTVVTRGAIETPELYVPGVPLGTAVGGLLHGWGPLGNTSRRTRSTSRADV